MYSAEQCLPVVRSPVERENEHPVVSAYRQHEDCLSFQRDECIRTVRPAYQGLISQLDHHLGRIFDSLTETGVLDDTLVIFTADHGDFLGDHWLGEKELFYDTVQKVPFIVVDPRREADATRGSVDSRMVEAVDVVPTVLDALGLALPLHRLEGRSLLPLLRGEPTLGWRDFSYSELDYSWRQARITLGKGVHECRGFSLRTEEWRYVWWLGEREQLWHLPSDPDQFSDLGGEKTSEAVRLAMRGRLVDFLARRRSRTTVTDEQVERGTAAHKRAGVFYGQW
jgi:arylsulfatase A-like enzyme